MPRRAALAAVEGEEVEARFERVGFNSADRSGVWFEKLIERHNVLPNPLVRYCTKDLKIRTLHRYMRSLGHTSFLDVVGLRADEMHRVERLANSTEAKRAFAPMAAAGHTENDVLKFWREQPFDLGLQGFEGNCDLCFLKRRETLKRIIREGRADPTWWIKMEATKKVSPDGAGHLFRETTTFAEIARDAHGSPMLPMFDDGDEHDVECGLACDLGYDPAADVERAIAFAKDHPYRPPQ